MRRVLQGHRGCWKPAALFAVAIVWVFYPLAYVQAQQPQANKSSAPHAGQSLFASRCAGCHGLDARGGEHAPNIATTPDVQRMSDPELLRIVRNGIPSAGMPAFGSLLKDDQLDAVVGYLRILQGKMNTAAVSGNPEAGRALFFGKAGCSECHMVTGRGGYFAADLSSYANGHSAEDIQKAIIDPGANLDMRSKAVTVVTRGGAKYTGLARNEDNFSIQLQTPDGIFHLFEKADIASLRHEQRSFMPAGYGSSLSSSELNDLIGYLVRTAQSQQSAPKGEGEF